MVYGVIILAVVCLILISLLVRVWLQIGSINRQLMKRSQSQSRQLITLSMEQKQMVLLVSSINRCIRDQEKSLSHARRSEKELKQLIANLSHDLRTPLTAIRGYLQLMEQSPLNAEEQNNLEVALRYTTELGKLIEHFFEYTYLTDAAPVMNLQRLNVTNLVIQVLADSVPMFEEQGLKAEILNDQPVMAYADKEMTIRILQNLIRNCIAHSGGDVKVFADEAEYARIHFINPLRKGYDVDPAQIFDRFYTGDTSRHRTTGLGLSIVKLLAERMGGRACAEVKEGQLEIIIELPVSK